MKTLIDALGGYRAVADAIASATGARPSLNSLYRWQIDGIPHRYRGVIVSLAGRRGVALPADFLPGVTNPAGEQLTADKQPATMGPT